MTVGPTDGAVATVGGAARPASGRSCPPGLDAAPRGAPAAPLPLRRAVAAVLLPFAMGYFLSYLFRTVTALAAERLGAELHLGADALGLLSSAYFLAFAAAQLPIGAALDRFGPRRVQLALLPVAAAGSALFASADGWALLVASRALIGLGVAAALMSGLKALVVWFPKERLALANGCYVMLGALGAVAATVPAEALLDGLGWRGLFAVLAAATGAVPALLWAVVPPDPPARAADAAGGARLAAMFRDGRFRRLAPLSSCCVGTAFALQGLWAGPWLADVAGLDRPGVVRGLFGMALGLSAGALSLGVLADAARRRGVRPRDLLAGVAAASMLAQLGLVLRIPVPPQILWSFIGAVGGATVLGFAALAESSPKAMAGRANAALNVLHIGAAFLIQSGIGVVVGRWPTDAAGHAPPVAYAAALGLALVPQAAGLAWYLLAPWGAAACGNAAPVIPEASDRAGSRMLPRGSVVVAVRGRSAGRAGPDGCARRFWPD